jgi:hypothetical protein
MRNLNGLKLGHGWNKGTEGVMKANSGSFKKGLSPWSKGKDMDDDFKLKISISRKGKLLNERHFAWKGDNAGYSAIHSWVRRHFGCPAECANCSFKSGSNFKIHWANKSKTYKRIKSDWIRLCVPCHKSYDLGKIKLK